MSQRRRLCTVFWRSFHHLSTKEAGNSVRGTLVCNQNDSTTRLGSSIQVVQHSTSCKASISGAATSKVLPYSVHTYKDMEWFTRWFRHQTEDNSRSDREISATHDTSVCENTDSPVSVNQNFNSQDMRSESPKTLEECQIFKWLQSGEFWTKRSTFRSSILPEIKKEFGAELEFLKTAYADRKGVGSNERSFGSALYPDEEVANTYYEIDRTLTAVLALLWIQNGEKDIFNSELDNDDWGWIRAQFQTSEANIFDPKNAETCYALLTSVITNDIGKSVKIAEAYKAFTKSDVDIGQQNHDGRLKSCVDAGMVPSYQRLPKDLQQDIILGINVAAECNLGQIAQAEDVPASVYPMKRFCSRARAWRLRFMEQVLDLAGAFGHFNNEKAAIFGKAVAQGNRSSHQVVEDVIFRGLTPKDAWDGNVVRKYLYVVQSCGYATQLDIKKRDDRALMRLFCLGAIGSAKPTLSADRLREGDSVQLQQETMTLNRELAMLYEEVLMRSPETADFRDAFITALNEDGLARPAVQVTYLPAMCSGAMNHHWASLDEKKKALACVFRWANKAMHIDPAALKKWKQQKVTVVEIDAFGLTQFIKGNPSSPSKFYQDPSSLASQQIPQPYAGTTVEPGFEADYEAAELECTATAKIGGARI